MSQSDHTTNFHDYVSISVHIRLYFVSVAQFLAKMNFKCGKIIQKTNFNKQVNKPGTRVMSLDNRVYACCGIIKFVMLGHKIKNPKLDQNPLRIEWDIGI